LRAFQQIRRLLMIRTPPADRIRLILPMTPRPLGVCCSVMTVADTERALVDELMILPDPQERLAHLMRRAARRPPWPASQRSESDLVPGCVSRVWLVGTLENDRCHFQVAADSPMVHGLMGLLCDVYEGAVPAEVMDVKTTIFTTTGLDRSLSPTRLAGLAQAQARLAHLAGAMAESTPESVTSTAVGAQAAAPERATGAEAGGTVAVAEPGGA
jgi:cysteine desulfuration protein SufE